MDIQLKMKYELRIVLQLKQFVEQYERALRSKVEKEFQADFRSFSQMIPRVSAYDTEKQFQASYTMDNFREFQEEITRLMYCKVICGLEEPKGTKFKVCEDVEFKGKIIKQRTVDVQFEIEQYEIVCSFHSFEFRGILWRHAVLVLLCKDVRSVPQKYILRRWKRDANRLYTWVKVNDDGWITTPGHEKYDELHREFLGLACLAADDEARFQEVKNWISVNAEFTSRAISGHESEDLVQPHNPVRSASVGEPRTSFSTQALDPKCTKRKGAPRTIKKKDHWKLEQRKPRYIVNRRNTCVQMSVANKILIILPMLHKHSNMGSTLDQVLGWIMQQPHFLRILVNQIMMKPLVQQIGAVMRAGMPSFVEFLDDYEEQDIDLFLVLIYHFLSVDPILER